MSLYFTKLFENHNILPEDRQKITEVLKSNIRRQYTLVTMSAEWIIVFVNRVTNAISK